MSKEQIIPIGEYLLVGMETGQSSESSLILNTTQPNNRGIVKAIGDKVNTDKDSTSIIEGDRIIFYPNSGIRVTNSEESDILVSIKNVIGIVREGE